MYAPNVDLSNVHLPRRLVGDEPWLAALAGGAAEVRVHRRCVGTGVRDDGWSCLGRRADAHWVLLALEGRSVGTVAGEDVVLEPGMLSWVPPGTPHSLRWTDHFRFAEVYFAVIRAGRHLCFTGRARVHHGCGEHKRTLDRIADEVQLGGPHHEARLRALLVGLTIDLWRWEQPGDASTRGFTRAQQARLLDRVRADGAGHLTPADLADVLMLSPDYFSRRFRITFGVCPRVWLNRRRLEEAAVLLEQTDLPVYVIADQFGYAGPAQFIRQFRQVMGQPPRAYRARGGER